SGMPEEEIGRWRHAEGRGDAVHLTERVNELTVIDVLMTVAEPLHTWVLEITREHIATLELFFARPGTGEDMWSLGARGAACVLGQELAAAEAVLRLRHAHEAALVQLSHEHREPHGVNCSRTVALSVTAHSQAREVHACDATWAPENEPDLIAHRK